MKKLIAAIGLIATQFYFGQDEDFLPKIIPPSPQAAELGKYGNVPIGMFTGSPNVNLNIYTLQESGISIPVNITYNSNGVQIDGVAKQLGIDWNLIAGGVISRQINDLDDLQFPFNNVNTANLCLQDSAEGASIANGTIDTEKDIFSFNFLGNSGKFYFDGNNIVQIEPSNIKIEKLAAPNNATPKFKIIDNTGTEYFFGGTNAVESSFNRSHCGGVQPPTLFDTAWYLTKIITTSGNEVTFNYQKENFQYIQSYYQTAISGGNYNNLSNAVLSPPCYNELRHETSFLSEVIANDKKLKFTYQKIDLNSSESKQLVSLEVYNNISNVIKKFIFNYDSFGVLTTMGSTNSYTNSNEKHIFLKNIKDVIPSTGENVTKYSFEYYAPDQLPPRHSFAKDIYGYYNGASNNNMIYNNLVNQDPVNSSDVVFKAFQYINSNRNPNSSYTKNGMLKNIYYPTKGKTEFIYEPNSVAKQKIITPPIQTVANVSIAESVGYGSEALSQVFTVSGNVTGILKAVAWRDCGADDPVHPPQVTATVINANTGATIKTLSTNETPANTNVSLVPGINYKIKIKVLRPCLGANAFIEVPGGAPYTITVNDEVAGMRVAKTLDHDNNGNVETKRYFYGKLESLNTSSAIFATQDPTIARNVDAFETNKLYNYSTSVVTVKLTMNSSPIVNLFSLDGYILMYPYVVESFGDNFKKGGILHNFFENSEIAPEYICGGQLFRGISFSNNFLAGKEKQRYVFKKVDNSIIPVSNEEFTYSENTAFNKTIANYVGRLTSTREHVSADSYGNTSIVTLKYYGINRYKLNTSFRYLSLMKKTDYLEGTPVQTQTEYFYTNPLHFQLTKEKATSADGIINETIYSYAHEKGNQLLIDRNMVGIPLEKMHTQTSGTITKTLGKTETIYPASVPTVQTGNLILPLEVKSYDILNNIVSTEVKYDRYDEKGNILQYTTKDGLPVAIVWGYNKTQPIAKVEGITYDQLTAAVSISAIVSASDQDASNPATENQLLTALNDFRKQTALSEKQITTFTYDPLIGVTSITPPTGIREIYSYDAANRLKEVKVREKDSTGNYVYRKVKEFNYNYKQ
ncbi:hypothetical protein EG349_01395 [Chryseobacterium shandongense]|uniref:YD repeat-containing protein n=1 Tax=Chryseobacterium shandongense TaxID=1493872 RepID=A0AAD0YBZ7_9FLAO|nr:hypothetical protein [Chryseobacterium shandongense]AZA85539.1 hypothetical protein EG349_01395 [Chryseobacterium shandongense]AZA97711.1 hypothetical protein EG353_20210 [Chryseobacterium shandongense]